MWCATRSTTAIPAASSPATLAGLLVSSRTRSMPERAQHRRGMAIVALVVGKAEPPVGIDRVEPAVLKRIGAELVGEADAAPFLAQIKQHAAALRADQPQRLLQLRPAIAFQAPNTSPVRHSLCSRTSGGLPPNAPTISATCSCAVVGAAEGDDLGVGQVRRAEARRARQASTVGLRRGDCARPQSPIAALPRSSSHSAGSSPAEPRQRERRRGLLVEVERPPAAAGRSARAPKSRPGSASAERAARVEPSARGRAAPAASGSAASRSLASDKAAARAPLISSGAARPGSSSSSMLGGRRLDRRDRDRLFAPSIRTGAAGRERGDRVARPCRCRSKRELADQRHMVATAAPSCGTARAPGARRAGRQARARPTYGRAGGRGRSWSSRASDSSTR